MGTSTSENVARNIREIRRARGMSLRDLETTLNVIGHPLALSALSKIENLGRRVDADDLTAIALALDVSPLALLIPATRSHLDEVAITGARQTAASLWRWGIGEQPLDDTLGSQAPNEDPEGAWRRVEFTRLAHPWWSIPHLAVTHERMTEDVLREHLSDFDAGKLGQGALRPQPREDHGVDQTAP